MAGLGSVCWVSGRGEERQRMRPGVRVRFWNPFCGGGLGGGGNRRGGKRRRKKRREEKRRRTESSTNLPLK